MISNTMILLKTWIICHTFQKLCFRRLSLTKPISCPTQAALRSLQQAVMCSTQKLGEVLFSKLMDNLSNHFGFIVRGSTTLSVGSTVDESIGVHMANTPSRCQIKFSLARAFLSLQLKNIGYGTTRNFSKKTPFKKCAKRKNQDPHGNTRSTSADCPPTTSGKGQQSLVVNYVIAISQPVGA